MSRRRTRTYETWLHARQRCRNPKDAGYDNYGARGITFCERWNDYTVFLADMGERPKGLTLERIDNDGNYEPGNCRWATRAQQNRNKRSNRLVELDGQLVPRVVACESLGIPESFIRSRMHRGDSFENAVLGYHAHIRGEAIRRLTKTHCVHGHAYAPDNVYWLNGKRRGCLICHRMRGRGLKAIA